MKVNNKWSINNIGGLTNIAGFSNPGIGFSSMIDRTDRVVTFRSFSSNFPKMSNNKRCVKRDYLSDTSNNYAFDSENGNGTVSYYLPDTCYNSDGNLIGPDRLVTSSEVLEYRTNKAYFIQCSGTSNYKTYFLSDSNNLDKRTLQGDVPSIPSTSISTTNNKDTFKLYSYYNITIQNNYIYTTDKVLINFSLELKNTNRTYYLYHAIPISGSTDTRIEYLNSQYSNLLIKN